jgi:hypothetical protein
LGNDAIFAAGWKKGGNYKAIPVRKVAREFSL